MATIQARVSRLEGAFEQLDQRLGDLQAAVHRHEAKTDAQFRTTMAMTITIGIAIAGAIVTLAFRI